MRRNQISSYFNQNARVVNLSDHRIVIIKGVVSDNQLNLNDLAVFNHQPRTISTRNTLREVVPTRFCDDMAVQINKVWYGRNRFCRYILDVAIRISSCQSRCTHINQHSNLCSIAQRIDVDQPMVCWPNIVAVLSSNLKTDRIPRRCHLTAINQSDRCCVVIIYDNCRVRINFCVCRHINIEQLRGRRNLAVGSSGAIHHTN